MANCNYVSIISPSECIGDSLFKINTNFNNLNSVVCDQSTSIQSLSSQVVTNTPFFRIENNFSELNNQYDPSAARLISRLNLGLGTAALGDKKQLVKAWGLWLNSTTSYSYNIQSMSYSGNLLTITFPAGIFDTTFYTASISVGEFYGGIPQVNRPYIATIASQTATQMVFRIWQIEPTTGVPTLVTDVPSRMSVTFYGGDLLPSIL
jgi:hypothetical protein